MLHSAEMAAVFSVIMTVRCLACKRACKTLRSLKLHVSKSQKCWRFYQELQTNTPHDRSSRDIHSFQPAPPNPLELHPEQDSGLLPDSAPPTDLLAEPSVPQAKKPRIAAEETDEGLSTHYVMKYPGPVAEVIGTGQTDFQVLRARQESEGLCPWHPFERKDEWELAEWLMRRVGKRGLEEFVKLDYV